MEDNIFEIKRYSSELLHEWNQFVYNSKNGTFLFHREYMDYHSDRFFDHSLMIYRKNKLYALLPGNIKDETFYSHQGLTYGGLLMSSKVNVEDVLEIFRMLNDYFRNININKVIYKPIPYIYHRQPAQEDIYALFRICNANKIGVNISSTIYQNDKIKFVESRKSGIRKAIANGLHVENSEDFKAFWDILNNNLINKYGVAPVHSIKEIELLKSRFPKNIKLHLVYKEDIVLGGTVIYITDNVIHTQYISASPEGKELGALDLLFDKLINQTYTNYPIFDFGQSTEDNGNILNKNLIFQKEGFGGRGMCYDIYEYDICSEEIELVDFDHTFLDKSWEWLHDPEIIDTMRPYITTKKSQKLWFNNLPYRTDYKIWGVNLFGSAIGVVGLKNIDSDKGEYFGYIGDPSRRGKGYGREIIKKLIEKAKVLRLSNINLKVLRNNERAIHLYKKSGFINSFEDAEWLYMNLNI